MPARLVGTECEGDGCDRIAWRDGLCRPCWDRGRCQGRQPETDASAFHDAGTAEFERQLRKWMRAGC